MILGQSLEQFKKINSYLFNFRCPICGDSKKNKYKSRGYIYRLNDQMNVKCHNCNYSSRLSNFIKTINPSIYNEYLLDNLGNVTSQKEDIIDTLINKPVIIKDKILHGLQRLDTLSLNHPAINYVIKRKIPRQHWKLFFFTPKFKKYINSIDPSKFEKIENDYPRLIIPYYNEHSVCFGISARAFGSEEPKYYNMKIDENEEFVYGMERINKNEQIYCVEGAIDSLFIPNSIAASGTSFNKSILQELKQNLIVIPDNEPRSPVLVSIVENIIDNGYKIVLWPNSFVYKDINKAIMEGVSQEQLLSIINNNITQGMVAKLNFNSWRKC